MRLLSRDDAFLVRRLDGEAADSRHQRKPNLLPPPVEDQALVIAEAERLGQQLGKAVHRREAERAAALERALSTSSSLMPLRRVRLLTEQAGDDVTADSNGFVQLVSKAGAQTERGDARGAIISLLELARRLLSSTSWQPEKVQLVVEESRRAVAQLYDAATS